MKKTIIIAAALVFSAGVLSSQVKMNNAPKIETLTVQKAIITTDRKDLATAD